MNPNLHSADKIFKGRASDDMFGTKRNMSWYPLPY